MVPWWLCLVAFFVGVLFGGFILALLESGTRTDKLMEKRLEDMKRAGW